ncbi:AP2/ERF family transcription factor [Candidatus Oscillochloris fontis]|uniref:AP2/ERF family transcription factor n=1 Tax=Candidatus Oscillochloris fontis TaxID=2496868 RepID=UPI001930F2A7|nr:AP2/ERF family transcription factor [Candidatus Oscillochloris fontis]
MKSVQHRRRGLNPNDDAQWESLVREAAAQLPENLAPPLSDLPLREVALPPVSAPASPSSSVSTATAARKIKSTRYVNITRMDYAKSQGYFVRVRWKGEARSKLFSDSVYGDRLSALAAAIEWRDQMTKELGKPRPGAPPPANTGIHRRMRGGREVYEATWSVNGKRGRTTYSIEKHGAKRAKALAIAARQRAMADSRD